MFLQKVCVFAALLCLPALLSGQKESNSPEVLPGVMLPASGIVFGLDTVSGKTTLVQVHATEVAIDSHAGSNFARAQVFAGPHRTIELTGVSSAATFHLNLPTFYVKISGDDPDLLRNRIKLIRLKTVKDRRIASDFSMNVWGGQRKRNLDEIAVEKSDFGGGQWLKLTLRSPLEPGEYGVVFMPKDQNLFADAVYDFNIAGDRKEKKD